MRGWGKVFLLSFSWTFHQRESRVQMLNNNQYNIKLLPKFPPPSTKKGKKKKNMNNRPTTWTHTGASRDKFHSSVQKLRQKDLNYKLNIQMKLFTNPKRRNNEYKIIYRELKNKDPLIKQSIYDIIEKIRLWKKE